MEVSSSLVSGVQGILASFTFLSSDPFILASQVGLACLTFSLIFLVFWTTRDVLLRTHSFLAQVASIGLVALFPIIGFLLYVLLRPARTIAERDLSRNITLLSERLLALEETVPRRSGLVPEAFEHSISFAEGVDTIPQSADLSVHIPS